MANKKTETSRKWILVLLIVAIGTFGAFFIPLLSILLHTEKLLVILTGTEFVSLISIVVGAYFAGNVWEKGTQYRNGVYSSNSGDMYVLPQNPVAPDSGVQAVTIEEDDANKHA